MKNKMTRWIEFRAFFGKIYNYKADTYGLPYRYSYSLSGTSGFQDVFYEEYFMGRNETTGLWGSQRMENLGGFKSNSWYGTTNNWLTSGNVYLDLPIKIKGLLLILKTPL